MNRLAAAALALGLLGGALALGGCERPHPAPPPPPAESTLQPRLSAIAHEADGTVAVSVVHLRTGARASVNGDLRLPMMSVFKLPLAVVTLAAVDAGQWKMDTKIPISAGELVPEGSPVAEAWAKGEKAPTLETLLKLVIQQSDNTAGDKLVALNGGGPKITESLRKLGFAGIDVAEQEINIFARIKCAGTKAPPTGWTIARMAQCHEGSAAAQQAAARQEILSPPNGATTDAMAELLAGLDHGTVLSPASRKWFMSILAGTATGPHRLKGALPEGTPVAHKTGTGDTIGSLNIATNDVGIVTLPNGDRFAIAVFIAGSHGDLPHLESQIARLARATYDVFSKP